jgi:hypothetical protein
MRFLALLVVLLAASHEAVACPFCTALKPTLSQRREESAVVVMGECLEAAPKRATFRVHQVFKQSGTFDETDPLTVPIDMRLKPGALAILFGAESASGLDWTCQSANELSLGYFVKAPAMRMPAAERLRYFVRFLQHADSLVAEDAFNEFGDAPYDAVQEVAELLPAESLRRWLVDPNVREERKGFYGLALGLSGRLKDSQRQTDFLRQRVLAPANDFRAGFDGILAGYLLLAGEGGLELIETRFLANPQAKDGDVRHAMAALRFYQEFEHEIPTARLARALRHLLKRSDFVGAAIVELARWQDWDALPQVAGLYTADPPLPPATRRAIVGYLLNDPQPQAAVELQRLRRLDPQAIAQAEKELQLSAGDPQKD